MIYTVIPHTSALGSNPGKGAFLIEGCGFEPHFQSAFDICRPGPNACIALCSGDARSGTEASQQVALHDGTREVSLLEGVSTGSYTVPTL